MGTRSVIGMLRIYTFCFTIDLFKITLALNFDMETSVEIRIMARARLTRVVGDGAVREPLGVEVGTLRLRLGRRDNPGHTKQLQQLLTNKIDGLRWIVVQ